MKTLKKSVNIIINIVICLIVGFMGSLFQRETIQTWYPTLNKPHLTPPNLVFPIAWTILYILMGTSIGIFLNGNQKDQNKNTILSIYTIQLFLNFIWSICFFYMKNPAWGFIIILLLDIFVLVYIFKIFNISKLSSILFIPYALWILFASYLNLYIFIYN